MFQHISEGDVWPTRNSEFTKLLKFMHVLTKKYSYFWLMNRKSLLILSATTVWHGIERLSCSGYWLILSVLLGDFHKPWMSLWAGMESRWSAGHHWPLLLLPADPQPSSSPGAAAQGRDDATWDGSATTKVTSSWRLLQMPQHYPSFSPPTFRWIRGNCKLGFSDSQKTFPALLQLGVATDWHQKWHD